MPRKVTVEVSPSVAKLRLEGFVHVTGLPLQFRHPMHTIEDGAPCVQASTKELGRWCQNNGRTVIITVEGEVWLRDGYDFDRSLIAELAPNGEGAFVPCSNGETIEFRHLLGRVADPYESFEDSGENLSPIPKPRG